MSTLEPESTSLSSRERRQRILDLASTSGLASVEELSLRFGVTASTIRRDLAKLTEEGLVTRTYGGAVPTTAHPEETLRQRTGEAYAAKRGIARWAAAQVLAGETVLLDAGTTVGALAHELRTHTSLTAVTVGLTALEALAEADDVEVISLGGELRHVSQGFIGPFTEANLERVTADRVFLGADGVTAEDGICEADHRQTRLKELMARRAGRVYVLAHAGKLGHRPFHAWARLQPGWTLVTDDSADARSLAPFHVEGLEVVVVDAEGRAVV
ncbi:DeoR/GlpR family DNA-binding transcription regulator [Kineococcus sp. SYSU DK003]|uniref:DeoR/GlpR family DNA-binding transcription regulator n=1 Tax=Kineococcus sp. SYSU DK003 TaxID=3383124 RepID=UPI003D7DB1A6